jgi:hypothetical protein
MEDWKNGRLEKWKIGKMEDWKNGRLEKWKIGKMEDWDYTTSTVPSKPSSYLLFLP